MIDIITLSVYGAGLVFLLEIFALWWNVRDYIVPVECSVRYRPIVRVRLLTFVEPRLRQFLRMRWHIGWIFFFGPLGLAVWVMGQSWQTAALAAGTAAHLAITWIAWFQFDTICQIIRGLPETAKQRFVILRAAKAVRLHL